MRSGFITSVRMRMEQMLTNPGLLLHLLVLHCQLKYDTIEVSNRRKLKSSKNDVVEVVPDTEEPPALKCKALWVWPHRNLKGKGGPTVKANEHKMFDFECGCIHGEENLCPTEKLSDHTVILKDCDIMEDRDRATWITLPSVNNTFMFENLQSGRCMEIIWDDWYEEDVVTNPCNISNPNQRFTQPNPEAFLRFPPPT